MPINRDKTERIKVETLIISVNNSTRNPVSLYFKAKQEIFYGKFFLS